MRTSVLLLLFASLHIQAQNYFQQEVNYTIDVSLDDVNHTLDGQIEMEYHNNSPNELHFIWIHLWPNAYKNKQTAMSQQNLENGDTDFYYADEKDRGHIDNLNFTVDGVKVKMEYHPEHIDICKVILNEPLKAGSSVLINTPFFVKIPDARFSRLGHVGQAYMITQWYPKPAVYDQNGWHPMPYLSQGEFFSEFGSFDVSITLPDNYTVGATGVLQNEEEIARLNQLANRRIKKASVDTLKKGVYRTESWVTPSSSKNKTLHYKQDKVHDFAWFANKDFQVLKGEVALPHSNDTVTTWAMFTENEATLWKKSIEYLNDAVYYYSLWNGDYPYAHCTAVDGTIAAGGGMEYPMVTVIGESGSSSTLETVIVHEVGHNWFYGILGNNEREHPWMDEGLNSFNESRYMHTKYKDKQKGGLSIQVGGFDASALLGIEHLGYKQLQHEMMFRIMANMGKDQAIADRSEDFTNMNYGCIVYGKSSIVFDYLRAYLGDELFDKAMKSYYEKWKFKHPQPKDLQNVLEEVSQKDLTWFFKGLIESQDHIDYAICHHKKGKLKLKNKGKVMGPLAVQAIKNEEVVVEKWVEGFEKDTIIDFAQEDYEHIRIDHHLVLPELNRQNNILQKDGLLKRQEPLKLKFGLSYDKAEESELYYLPSIGWNQLNQWNFGLRLYNRFLPKTGWSFSLNPQYSTGTDQLVGKAKLFHHWYSGDGLFEHLKIGVDAKQFAFSSAENYLKISPQIEAVIGKRNKRSPLNHKLTARYIYLEKSEQKSHYLDGHYLLQKKSSLHPFKADFNLQKGKEFMKAQLTLVQHWYISKDKRIRARFFTGSILKGTASTSEQFHLGGLFAANDYLMDHFFLNRAALDGLHSRQLYEQGGFMKFKNGQSYTSMSSINLELPVYKMMDVYLDAARAADEVFNGMGFKLSFMSDHLNIYLPIYNSHNGFVDWSDADQHYFSLNLKLDVNSLISL
jgi:hypothetical protein